MNGKRAKMLRKAAREHLAGKGLPDRVLHTNPRTTKEYTGVREMRDEAGELILNDEGEAQLENYKYKAAYGAILGPSVRHLYCMLRKQYLQWLRTGVIKARRAKYENKERYEKHKRDRAEQALLLLAANAQQLGLGY